MQAWLKKLQNIFSGNYFKNYFKNIKRVTSLALVILFICIGYNLISHISLQNSLKVEIVSGNSSIISSGNETVLTKNETYIFKRGDNLIVQNNSIALIIFSNGKIQTFGGFMNLAFQDASKEENGIKYSFQNKDTGESFFYKQSYGLTESTATVLGFLHGSNNSANKISGGSGNVLGASEIVKLSDEEKQEKLIKLTNCIQVNKKTDKFNYSAQLNICLNQLGLKNLSELK